MDDLERTRLRTRLVAATELEREIGSIASRITPEARRAALRARCAGNLRRYRSEEAS